MTPPRDSLLARAPIIDTLNGGLQRAWDSGWLSPIELNPGWLWNRATRKQNPAHEASARSAEDVADFRERLSRLCQSIGDEARLNPIGRSFAYGQITRSIRQRLGLGRLWAGAPEILKTRLAPPIIVLGQMRAGTTRVHRLLAADPAHTATRFCDSWNPVPTQPDLRPAWSGLALFWARKLNPWIDTLHPFGAARYDEELGWLAGAFDHSAYEAQWHIPSFVAFSEARTPAPVYREFARILQTDASHHGNASKPRVMKVPQFSEDLPALLQQFPDARIVMAERNCQQTVDSSVSLVANQMAMQSDHVDIDRLRREWTRKTELRRQRTEHALNSFGGPVARIDFEAMDRDWKASTQRLYTDLGIELTDAARKAMQREQARAAQSDHGKHSRDLGALS